MYQNHTHTALGTCFRRYFGIIGVATQPRTFGRFPCTYSPPSIATGLSSTNGEYQHGDSHTRASGGCGWLAHRKHEASALCSPTNPSCIQLRNWSRRLSPSKVTKTTVIEFTLNCVLYRSNKWHNEYRTLFCRIVLCDCFCL